MSASNYAPTLEENSFADPSIATVGFGLGTNRDGSFTNQIELLVRPIDIRGDESGRLYGTFALIFITREELRALLAECDTDFALQEKHAPVINEPAEMAAIAACEEPKRQSAIDKFPLHWTLQTR